MSEQTTMSEQPASICTNCGSTKHGEYCSACGQNSRNYLRAAYRVIGELLSETFEFDSRLFRSLRYLILSPGFLTNEFSAGRRAHYISPVRMYLVVSLLFFFLLSVTAKGDIMIGANGEPIDLDVIEASLAAGPNLENPEQLRGLLMAVGSERRAELLEALAARGVDTAILEARLAEIDDKLDQAVAAASAAASDTVADASERAQIMDSEFETAMQEKFEALAADPGDAFGDFIDNLPLTMFLLLPFFALLLKATYPRRFYSEHFVFALHFHSFLYLVLTVLLFIPEPAVAADAASVDAESAGVSAWQSLERILVFGCVVYGFVALKKAYRQSIGLTVVKGLVLMSAYSVMLAIGLSLAVVATFVLY